MPKQYEDIRDSYIKSGKPVQEAKKLAAMTYNKSHPGNPVTRNSDKKDPDNDGDKHAKTKSLLKNLGK